MTCVKSTNQIGIQISNLKLVKGIQNKTKIEMGKEPNLYGPAASHSAHVREHLAPAHLTVAPPT
jgi:hypothetical protein